MVLVIFAALTLFGGAKIAATYIGTPQTAGYFAHADKVTVGAEKFTEPWMRRAQGSNNKALALDGAKRPHVAWSGESDVADSYALFYAFWDGSKWRGKLNANGPDQVSVRDFTSIGLPDASIAIDGAGKPHIAWSQFDINEDGDYKPFIFYRYWNGSAWTGKKRDIDKISDNTTEVAAWPDIAVSAQGTPYIVYTENELPVDVAPEVRLKYWDGSNWIGKTGASFDNLSNSLTWSMYPSMAINGNHLHVAWIEWESPQGAYQILSTHWDGTKWRGFNADKPDQVVPPTNAFLDSPDLALSRSGIPTIVWEQNVGSNSVIKDAYWNGQSWVSYGSAPIVGTVTDTQPVVAVATNDYPTVAWVRFAPGDNSIFVKKWNGSKWVGLNGKEPTKVNDTIGYFWKPSLDLDSSGNPALTWEELDDDFYKWGVWFTNWVPSS